MPPACTRLRDRNIPAVVIPLATQHYILLERNLLYTAVTRGKRLVVIIAQPRALAMAVKQTGGAR